MGCKHEPRANQINDFFINLIMDDVDISDPQHKQDIVEGCKYYFVDMLPYEEDLLYLSFNIIKSKNGESYKVVANNIVTALLFCGVAPYGCDYIMKQNRFENNIGVFVFNKKVKN